ncbi:MAG: hypothetical protein AAFR93_06360 [Pseudomonadota bacterium]
MADLTGCVILGDMRTGSNQLESNLAQFPPVVAYGEVFNPSFLGREGQDSLLGCDMALRAQRPEALLDAMGEAPGFPCFRLFPGHDARVERLVLDDSTWAKVILRRAPLDSFLSREAARQTGQWRLRREFQRQTQKVTFDADRFEAYAAQQAAHFAGWERQIRCAGQSYFAIAYPECGDLALLNGLAAWLGLDAHLDRLEETTIRQNPVSLAERVENLEELEAFLNRAGYIPHVPGSQDLGALDPIACDAVGAWAPHAGPNDGQPVGAALRAGSLSALPKFSVVDPLVRAQAIFEARILYDGSDLYPYIRKTLRRDWALDVPEEPLSIGERLPHDQYEGAFSQFLGFLAQNLKSATSIRQDPVWQSQAHYARALGARVPIRELVRQHRAWVHPTPLDPAPWMDQIRAVYAEDCMLFDAATASR